MWGLCGHCAGPVEGDRGWAAPPGVNPPSRGDVPWVPDASTSALAGCSPFLEVLCQASWDYTLEGTGHVEWSQGVTLSGD